MLAACGRSEPGRVTAIAEPTFTHDIAPILYSQCTPCHRPSQAAPFTLVTYADAKAHARAIAGAVERRDMPPWLPEPGYGDFAGARRLSDGQIAIIRAWVDRGAVEGRASDAPAMPQWADGWQLGRPDIVAKLPQPYTLSAGDADVFRNFVIPIDISRTVYVRGVELLPGELHAVHHAVVGVDSTRMSRRMDEKDPEPGYAGMFSEEFHSPDGHFAGWTPGRTGFLEAPDMSWRLEPGTDLVVQMHMLPSAAPRTIEAQIGLYLTDTPPARVPFMVKLTSTTIDIPSGEPNYTIDDSYTLPVDVDALSVYPHAHYLAREVRGDATLPDGSSRPLIWIRNWDFHWQDFYRYAAPVPLPRGTVVSMKFVYDNTAAHQRKPNDMPRRVVYGPRSSDEMGDLWLQVLPRRSEALDILARDFFRRSIEAGIQNAQKLVRDDPQSAPHHNFLGSRYLAAGRIADALLAFGAAVRLDPMYVEARNNLGAALVAAGRASEALPHLRLAARAKPGDDRVHFNLGNALKDAGHPADAVREFERSLAINPDAADTHNNLAVVFGSKGRYREAIEHLQRAVILREAYPEAHNNLAMALSATGDADAALDHVRRALALRPDYPDALENLRLLQRAQQNPR